MSFGIRGPHKATLAEISASKMQNRECTHKTVAMRGTPHTSMTVIVIPEDINAVRRKQLYRSVRCNIYAQQELQVGRNFGQMFWMGKQLLICAEMGQTDRNFGHTAKKAGYECMKGD